MDEDNRRGVLAGQDGDGVAMTPVTYRPKKPGVKLDDRAAARAKAQDETRAVQQRGAGGNLSSSEYRQLDGPPLAPRRQFSRVITNYTQSYGQVSHGVWEVVGAWIDVFSKKSVAFLRYHFDGTSKLPKRDLRGVRPWGIEKARKAARAWMIDQIRSNDA